MDLRLPGTNGTATVIEIRGRFPDARIIMLSMWDGDAEIQRAIRAGAVGYLLKNMPNEQLLEAFRRCTPAECELPQRSQTNSSSIWRGEPEQPRAGWCG